MANRFLNNIKINDSYTLPAADGTADQVITTNGSGQLSFVDQSAITAGTTEKVVIYAKNTHTTSIVKGTPVYITGTVGATDTVTIAPADASNSAKMPAVGILDATLAVNDFGYVITGGFMDNITTSPIDGTTPSSNDTVYVKAGGGLTMTKPTGSSNLIQNIAKVGKVSGGNAGSLIVSSILRTNDVPNLSTGKIWVGDGNTIESTVVHLDETNGRMGIGTTSPDELLHITGNEPTIKLEDNIGTDYYNPKIEFFGSTEGGTLEYIDNPGFSGMQLHYKNTSSNQNTFLRLTNGKAEFQSNINIGAILRTDGVLQVTGSNNSYFSNGNVGIGTTSPSASLSIDKTNVYQHRALDLENDSITYSMYIDQDNVGTDSWSLFDTTNSQTALKYLPSASGYWQFYTNNAERLRIDSSGRVGIGTTSPSEKLDVNGNIKLSETAAATDTDKFVVLDSGVLKYRTGAQVRSDIGAGTGDITGVTAGTYLTGGGTSGNVTINADSTQLAHIHDSSNGTVAAGWITVAQASDARKAGEIYVTDGESSDHSYIRIEWMRSYADSNFTVLNCGGHANRIVGVRVLEETADKTYGKKYIQVKVTTTSNYYVIVTAPGSIPMYGDFTAETPVLENTKTGYNVKGSQLENLQESSVGTDQGITVGGDLFVDGNVGIGTTSPGVKLQVGDGTNDDAVRSYMNDGSYTEMRGYGLQFSRAASYMRPTADNTKTLYLGSNVAQWNTLSIDASTTTFNTNGSENMRITSTGNVGIGTTSPVDKLQIDAPHSQLRLRDTDDGTFTQFSSSGNKLAIRQNSTSANHIWLTSSGNVGIGTSSPQQKLHVDGGTYLDGKVGIGITPTTTWDVIIKGQYPLQLTDSSSSAKFEFYGDLGENRYLNGAKIVGYGQDLFIDTSSSGYDIILGPSGGNVGIGTTSPTADLSVGSTSTSSGDVHLRTTKTTFSMTPSNTDAGGMFLDVGWASGGQGPFRFGIGGSEKMRIDSSGRVGIGTASPASILHLVGQGGSGWTLGARNTLHLQNANVSSVNVSNAIVLGDQTDADRWYIMNDPNANGTTANVLTITNAGSERMRITSTGNVGIGTTSPSQKLEVVGNAILDASNANLKIKAGGVGTIGSIDFTFNTDSTQYGLIDLNYDSRASQGFRMKSLYPITLDAVTVQKFLISGSEKMRIRSTGNVGIGTTSPTQRLDVNGDIAIKNANQLSFNSNNGTLSVAIQAGQLNLKNSSIFINYSSNVGIGTTTPSYLLEVNGSAAKSTGTTWINTSDERTKENIQNYTKGLNDIVQLQPRVFDYNGKGSTEKSKENIGLIAQEVIDVYPEAIGTFKAKLDETDAKETDIYNLDFHSISISMINAIKELNEKVKILEDKIQILENQENK